MLCIYPISVFECIIHSLKWFAKQGESEEIEWKNTYVERRLFLSLE